MEVSDYKKYQTTMELDSFSLQLIFFQITFGAFN